jgi:hypothetical protein
MEQSKFAQGTSLHSSIPQMPSTMQKTLMLGFFEATFSSGLVDLTLFDCPSSANYLFQVFRIIYTGKSSALDGKRVAASPSQAERHGMKKATGETIAYAAMQVN